MTTPAIPTPPAVARSRTHTSASRPPTILYAGTWERGYPRNELIISALQTAGARVETLQIAVWGDAGANKTAVGASGMARLSLRLLGAYARLVPEVSLRLLRADALAIGYIGPLDMLLLAPLAKLLRRPVYFNPLITLTDTLVEDRQLVSPRSPLAWLLAGIDRATLHLADVVLVDTAANGAWLQRRFGLAAARTLIVRVGYDEAVFGPRILRDAEEVSPERPLDVLFYGKFIPLHGIETILRAAALCQARGLPLRFELVGTGQTYAAARALADELALRDLTWTDWLEPEALGRRLRRADVALGVFSAGEKAGRVVPNKVWQALACGTPVVTQDGPAAREVLRHGDDALLVPPDDPQALADALAALLEPRLRTRLAVGARAVSSREASASALARQVRPLVRRARDHAWRKSRQSSTSAARPTQ